MEYTIILEKISCRVQLLNQRRPQISTTLDARKHL